MINIFMDDCRKLPRGFTLARTTEECLLLLRECEVNILSLDYDMGPDDYSGDEVCRRMVLEGLFPRQIYLHTSSSWGRKEMYELLYTARPVGTELYNGPISVEVLAGIAAGAAGK
ncbi:cyclic-phosphate processing receiver domain-containing protein [Paenibacillus tianjinensis]|uniref:Cell division protein FtsJ n=1 Tax=Paenibacillus tianjinensis TaxID=2810347 RepID=A0ABX7L890_9BACL|nr:cyclic-phosphate processing receiver domain-containing protein [Paenibacillus tianjinensis]QSF42625.1 cell division protein FtsJ [Paenibacillus tianjinensis]